LAPVCADKFRAQPDAAAKTIALSKEVYSWNRAKDFPKELITLPGETDPNSAVLVGNSDFVVPTISFRLLYGLLIMQHARRQIAWLGVTAHPTAEWIARQLSESYGWAAAPRYIVRDRDAVYGDIFIRRLQAMGIHDRPIAARSPWQNGYAERLIGSIGRDCLDHVVVFGERHVRHLLESYQRYYNEARTHLSLSKDAPAPRAVQAVGSITAKPLLGGLHHQYVRI